MIKAVPVTRQYFKVSNIQWDDGNSNMVVSLQLDGLTAQLKDRVPRYGDLPHVGKCSALLAGFPTWAGT